MSPFISREDELEFLKEIPTRFDPTIGKILVTGASGYIGGRLVPRLISRGYSVRVMVRELYPEYADLWKGAKVVIADAHRMEGLERALDGIDTVYYLIHSLHLGPEKFEKADIDAARNFRIAAERMNVKRIIYLGGLGDITVTLSKHLQSRLLVAEELSKGRVPVTTLKAAVIIGSGSASYEILKHLVENLAVIPTPHWADKRCQPISVRDVLKYLIGVLENPETPGKTFDIGGRDILTYKDMMKEFAKILKLRRIFLPFPVSNIHFYSYFASFFTPVPASITSCLMEGIRNDVVCSNDRIKKYVPFEPLAYCEALKRALAKEERKSVETRWSEAYPPSHSLAVKLHEAKHKITYTSSCSIFSKKDSGKIFASMCKMGGREGWFHANWMWRIRGWMDRLFMGVGSARGKKDIPELRIGDVVDFWRIEDLMKARRLLLRAEMKLPGMAWLEFNVRDKGEHRMLSVTAYYSTKSTFGKIYWYIFLPFHFYLFKGLLKQIERRA